MAEHDPNRFDVRWRGHGHKAECEPNPDYPEGIHVDIAQGRKPCCQIDLPYPAPECGIHLVRCRLCGLTIGVTAAGRPDDPRSVVVPCLPTRPSSN